MPATLAIASEPTPTRPSAAKTQAILEEFAQVEARTAVKLSAPPVRIVLTGFMGAGKSTVGRLVAQQLGWRFLDVDDLITDRAGMSVAEVFQKLGEFVFRRMETSAIARALGERDAVIALGGGAPEVLANRLLLEQTPQTSVVLLQAPLATLMARCHAQVDGPERPNLAVAQERFQYRAPLYRRVARITLDTAEASPAETAVAVLQRLGLQPNKSA